MRQRHVSHVLATLSILLTLCFFSSVLSSKVSAHIVDDPISDSAQSSTLQFPKAIDFQIHAHDTQSPLEYATLHLLFNHNDSSEETHVVTPGEANDVTFRWHDDFTNSHFTPASTMITYYWVITDQADRKHTSSSQNLQIVDNRFQWQHLTQGLYQVNWYNRPTDFGQVVLKQVTNSLKHISSNLGTGLHQPINLWVYQNTDDFHSALPPQVSEWVGGIAFPGLNQASITASGTNDKTLSRDLPHELTHLVLHQKARGDIPTWFDEGLAVYDQVYHEPQMTNQFSQMITQHSLLRIPDLETSFPKDDDKAYDAYSESWHLVSYMYSTFGLKKMESLVQAIHSIDFTFDMNLQQVLGWNTAQIENKWRLSLNQSATLSAREMVPLTPTPTPISMPATSQATSSDGTESYLLVGGISLIVLPIIGCILLLIYVGRKSRKASSNGTPNTPFPSSVPETTPYPIQPEFYMVPETYTTPGLQERAHPQGGTPIPVDYPWQHSANPVRGGTSHTSEE
ncbi:peptidase MA family metallohydrolase [Dictyobacter arantiisoli]|uniref:Peptidase MA-like domain-containing protein n=1 Tax=Dictyobacter arantiisoli TaxID=2014874 RepID=A0A5A5T5B5_9CHLR|nr:peptidase MA family metallohydrolase [Dictyobacter arantiisoli]GCF06581.1 hypothetical protein KDI_01450 [Dictyobacter arantiisoli]